MLDILQQLYSRHKVVGYPTVYLKPVYEEPRVAAVIAGLS
jgi:hypothetical protein